MEHEFWQGESLQISPKTTQLHEVHFQMIRQSNIWQTRNGNSRLSLMACSGPN